MEHLEQLYGFDLEIGGSVNPTSVKFGEVSVGMMLENYKPMFLRHWQEVAIYKKERPLDPDWALYLWMAKLGKIRCFAATDVMRGLVVAYSVYLISSSLHYKSWIMATNDIYYVERAYRRSPERWLAKDFFEKADEWLKSYGVQSIRYPVKAHLDHSDVFRELGYAKVEDIYERLVR